MAGLGHGRANVNLNSSPSESDREEFQVDVSWARALPVRWARGGVQTAPLPKRPVKQSF